LSAGKIESGSSYLWFAAAGLVLYCVLLTAVTGDIGFDGDDWWVLAYPYWNSFPDAVILYASKFLRPVEGLYWISLFEIFGFNKVAFHLCSLLLLAGSAVLMGASLDRVFPDRRDCISIAILLVFFLPTVSCLTYVMFTDNSRLSMLLFWTCVLAFQRWAQKSLSWRGLMLPAALYVCSFLTYEAASFLIFIVPLLVWPVHLRCSGEVLDRPFLVGTLGSFGAAVAVRYVFLNGGAVGNSYLLPPFELIWSYLALLPFYLIAPFTAMSADRWALVAGVLVVLGSAGLLIVSSRGPFSAEPTLNGRFNPGSRWYLVVLGLAILVLGMLPYQIAGYGSFSPRLVETLTAKWGLLPGADLSWFNFTWASRIYSSASIGVAILLAAGLSGFKKPSTKMLGMAAAVVIIGFMAVFHAGLSVDWREAAEIKNDLMQSLVSQAPAVKPGTNFVFLNLNCSHKRAEVIRKENGLRDLIEMLYGDQTLRAWYVYPHAYDPNTHVCHQSTAMPEGFMSRGQRQDKLAPPESLLVFERSGRELHLLRKITAYDGAVATGIAWRGVESLASNFGLIEAWRTAISTDMRFAQSAWTSGLISTLRLTRLKSTLESLQRVKKRLASRTRLRHHFWKMPH
jgi:hypothetical protein